MYGYKDIGRQSFNDPGVMHRGLLLIRSSIVACTNGKVDQTINMNATFLTAVVCYVIGTTFGISVHYGTYEL